MYDKMLNNEAVLWDFLIIKICKFRTLKITKPADLTMVLAVYITE